MGIRLIAVLLLCLPALAGATTHWVVGSFEEEARAVTEAKRLEQALGLPVVVTRSPPYRLLVDYDVLEAEAAEALFLQVGINGAWRITEGRITEVSARTFSATPSRAAPSRAAPSRAAPSRPELTSAGGIWLLAAEVDEIQRSIDIELDLARIYSGVSSESVLSDGELVHRVMLGLVREEDEPAILSRLRAMGLSPKRMAEVPDRAGAGFVQLLRTMPKSTANPVGRPDEQKKADSDGFNFATLRPRKEKASPR